MNINELPVEILEMILSYLPTKDKFRYERVCKLWQSVIFKSIKILAFADNKSCNQHKNLSENVLNHEIPSSDAMKVILKKCGKNLGSFFGKNVTYETLMIILGTCQHLHCVDIMCDDLRNITLLVNALGQQLTCAHFYAHVALVMTKFLPACPKLTSVRITDIYEYGEGNIEQYLPPTKKCKIEEQPSIVFSSLRHLHIITLYYLEEDILEQLALLTNLESVSLRLTSNRPMSVSWKSVWKSWANTRIRIEMKCMQEVGCLGFESFPQNLELLSVIIRGWHNLEREDCKLFNFSCFMPKLKIIELYYHELLPAHLNSVLMSISCYCPALEEFALGGSTFDGCADDLLQPLLSFTSLKRLLLGCAFNTTDHFMAKLIAELQNLRTLYSVPCSSEPRRDELLAWGPLFWQAFMRKAIFHPEEQFAVQGRFKGTLQLDQLPPNVSLVLEGSLTIKLINGFGSTKHWQLLTSQWIKLDHINIETQDCNLLLDGVPKNVQCLTIGFLNDSMGNTLSLNTLPAGLAQLAIFQQYMSNEQLGRILECVGKFCPEVNSLCIDRGNVEREIVEDQLYHLFNCRYIRRLCITDNFLINDHVGAQLVKQMVHLTHIGCYFEGHEHKLGFEFGSEFLKTLAVKSRSVQVKGGPSKWSFMDETESLEMLNYISFE